MYFASKNFYTGTTLIPSIFAPLQSRNSASRKNHNLFFRLLKAKPYSEMISDAEGVERPEVSLLLIILLVLFDMELLLSPHSIPVPLTLHFMSFVNSEVHYLPQVCPPLRSRGLALCFFCNIKKICKKKLPRGFSPQGFSVLIHHYIIAIIVYIKFRSVYVFYHILAYLCDEILFQ